MSDKQLHALLIRAFDGVQQGAKIRPREVSDAVLAGVWWTLLVVSRAMEDNAIALDVLEELANGNVDLYQFWEE